MKEVISELLSHFESDRTCALATVVRTWKSAPRPAGASMFVTDTGEVTGSISGGCIEGAVYELGQEIIKTGKTHYETYGVSDDDAFAVGLAVVVFLVGVGVGFLVAALALLLISTNANKATTTFLNPDPI